MADPEVRHPPFEQANERLGVAKLGRGLLLENVAEDVAHRLGLDQRSVGDVERLELVDREREEIEQPAPDLVGGVWVEPGWELVVEAGNHLPSGGRHPLERLPVERALSRRGLQRFLEAGARSGLAACADTTLDARRAEAASVRDDPRYAPDHVVH